MALIRKMAELEQREKMVKKGQETYPERKYEYMEEHLTINGLKKDLLKEIDKWDRENSYVRITKEQTKTQKYVVAYAQFMSMSGAKKFLKATESEIKCM